MDMLFAMQQANREAITALHLLQRERSLRSQPSIRGNEAPLAPKTWAQSCDREHRLHFSFASNRLLCFRRLDQIRWGLWKDPVFLTCRCSSGVNLRFCCRKMRSSGLAWCVLGLRRNGSVGIHFGEGWEEVRQAQGQWCRGARYVSLL